MMSQIYFPKKYWTWIVAGYIISDNDKIQSILAKLHLVEGQDLHNERFHILEIYHKSLWCFKIFIVYSCRCWNNFRRFSTIFIKHSRWKTLQKSFRGWEPNPQQLHQEVGYWHLHQNRAPAGGVFYQSMIQWKTPVPLNLGSIPWLVVCSIWAKVPSTQNTVFVDEFYFVLFVIASQ